MKHYNKLMLATLLGAATVSCADDKLADYQVDKPESIARYEYLNAYDALKTYINPNANPDFKLGAGIAVSDFLKGDLVYSMATANFAELTAGNAMKYASCVKNDGSMDFDQVFKFVQAAKAAGLTIYGHTLAWHSQQNNKYLNSLIADKEIEIDPNAANNFIVYNTGTAGANSWDKQAIYTLPVALEAGADYKFTVDIKASDACQCGLWPIWDASPNKNQWGGSNDVQYLVDKAIGTEWDTYTWEFNAAFTHDKLQFVFGKHGGTIAFDNLILVKVGTDVNIINNGDFAEASTNGWGSNWNGPTFEIGKYATTAATYYVNQVENSEMKVGGSMANFIVREKGKGDVPATIIEGEGPNGMNCIKINSVANPSEDWDTQFFIYTPQKEWASGQKYKISFWYKASAEADCATQCHGEPGSYKHWAMLSQNPHFTTEWKFYEAEGTIPAAGDNMKSIAFNLNVDKNAVTYYFANIVWESEEKGNTIPLSPEEKKANLIEAMDKWIAGMMENTAEYVSVWDVVNEAIAGGGDNGEGFYPLQSASRASASDAANNFYWQDYLGSEDYVRIVVASARKHYAENGGTKPLQLFINDYNLESDWDDNKKLKSLVHWIEKWEADGKTKIDGIGTQMHVSYYANANTQKSKEDHIVKMLEILAKSGKLVKISELDMGYIDEGGNSVKTENITFEQQKQMADFYTFIIKKYFEIIPKAQQYGITQWATTDSPAGSGWREGQPIGLWDLNYNRKPTYAGFVEGLK